MQTALPQSASGCDRALHDKHTSLHHGVNLATFTHSIKTRVNGVKFAHQSLCNPKISTLLKAVRKGFLTGCPNLSKKLILKYLNPSLATSKGHMKRPQNGICSTRRTVLTNDTTPLALVPHLPLPPHLGIPANVVPAYIPVHTDTHPALIADDSNESIANLFCYGAFADRHSGVVYNDLTGSFPFVSYDGSVCFLVVYHYESNAILASPISNMEDKTIYSTPTKRHLTNSRKKVSSRS